MISSCYVSEKRRETYMLHDLMRRSTVILQDVVVTGPSGSSDLLRDGLNTRRVSNDVRPRMMHRPQGTHGRCLL